MVATDNPNSEKNSLDVIVQRISSALLQLSSSRAAVLLAAVRARMHPLVRWAGSYLCDKASLPAPSESSESGPSSEVSGIDYPQQPLSLGDLRTLLAARQRASAVASSSPQPSPGRIPLLLPEGDEVPRQAALDIEPTDAPTDTPLESSHMAQVGVS